jgi:hypothetical protein
MSSSPARVKPGSTAQRLLTRNSQTLHFEEIHQLKGQSIIPFFERSPVLLPFIADDRIHNMISRLLELGVGPPEPMPIFEG